MQLTLKVDDDARGQDAGTVTVSFPNSDVADFRVTAPWNAQPAISVEPRVLFHGKIESGEVGQGRIRLTATSANALALRNNSGRCTDDLEVTVSQVSETVVDIGVRWTPPNGEESLQTEL